MPRLFGGPNEITWLIEGDTDQTARYIVGLFVIAIILWILFLCWLIMLFVFKCCCKGTVLGGYPPKAGSKSGKIYRSIIFATLICILAIGILSITKGVTSVGQVFPSLINNIKTFESLLSEIRGRLVEIIMINNTLEQERNELYQRLEGGICPNENTTPIDDEVNRLVQTLRDMEGLASTVESTVGEKDNMLETLYNILNDNVHPTVVQVQGYTSIAYILSIIIFFAAFFILGEWFAWFGPRIKVYFCVQRVMLPIFFVSLVLSVIAAPFISAILAANSDVCVGSTNSSPDEVLQKAVGYEDWDTFKQELFDVIIIDGCVGIFDNMEDLSDTVGDIKIYLNDSKVVLNNFTNITMPLLEQSCQVGAGNLTDPSPYIQDLYNVTENAIGLAEGLLKEEFYCPQINAAYTSLAHSLVCTDVPVMVGWLFWVMITYTMCGCVLYTFRGALYPSEIGDASDENNDVEKESLNVQEIGSNSMSD